MEQDIKNENEKLFQVGEKFIAKCLSGFLLYWDFFQFQGKMLKSPKMPLQLSVSAVCGYVMVSLHFPPLPPLKVCADVCSVEPVSPSATMGAFLWENPKPDC